jgi:hypothetical protein
MQYNKAVGEANHGDKKAALATLHDLLEHATDETVIADARKLVNELTGMPRAHDR